ncbi:MAG: divergent PAP2 family protein [Intestinibacter sp.]
MTAVFAIIVMYDASVLEELGKQAELLNQIVMIFPWQI